MLDPIKDHQRIVFLTARCDFPFDMTRALEFALLRTFGVPSVAGLLDRTGEFTQRTQRRYDDTDLIISTMMDFGYDSEKGNAALQRMNEIHNRFKISNADYLYVLSTFIFEPIRWIRRCGWRQMDEREEQALYYFWREVGIRMAIRDIPASYAAFEQYNQEFEQSHFRFTEAGKRVATSTIAMFATWFPWPVGQYVPAIMHSVIDDTLIEALGLPRPPGWLVSLVATTLRWRGRIAHLFTWRRGGTLRSAEPKRSYPCGFKLSEIGPTKEHPTG